MNAVANLATIKVALIRTGFSTHAMVRPRGRTSAGADTSQNMGQRYLQLNSTYTRALDGSVTLHVSQLPPNPSLLVPGPALLCVPRAPRSRLTRDRFVVVNGVPSLGKFVMVGSGKLGPQTLLDVVPLPPSQISTPPPPSSASPIVPQTTQQAPAASVTGIPGSSKTGAAASRSVVSAVLFLVGLATGLL